MLPAEVGLTFGSGLGCGLKTKVGAVVGTKANLFVGAAAGDVTVCSVGLLLLGMVAVGLLLLLLVGLLFAAMVVVGNGGENETDGGGINDGGWPTVEVDGVGGGRSTPLVGGRTADIGRLGLLVISGP